MIKMIKRNTKDGGFEPFYCYICGKRKPYFIDVEGGDVRLNCYFFRIGSFDWIACKRCHDTLKELRTKDEIGNKETGKENMY